MSTSDTLSEGMLLTMLVVVVTLPKKVQFNHVNYKGS